MAWAGIESPRWGCLGLSSVSETVRLGGLLSSKPAFELTAKPRHDQKIRSSCGFVHALNREHVVLSWMQQADNW